MSWVTARAPARLTTSLLALALVAVGCRSGTTTAASPRAEPSPTVGASSPSPSASAATPASPSPSPTTTPTPPVTSILGLGDSVTAGSACACVDFVRLLGQRLGAAFGHSVHAVNRGHGGFTSADLLDQVRTDGGVRADIRASDAVVITIGANDLADVLAAYDDKGCDQACATAQLPSISARVAAVVRTVLSLRAGRPTRVLVTDYWNVFEDGDVGRSLRGEDYLAWSDQLTRSFNAALCPKVEAAGATCVDLYAPFKGDGGHDPTPLLAGDGDHPNAAGHALIADVLTRVLT